MSKVSVGQIKLWKKKRGNIVNYAWEIYKVLESKGCEQISMEFDTDYKILEVKYKRKNQITNEMTDEMFTIIPKNYKTEKDLKAKVIRELYCI